MARTPLFPRGGDFTSWALNITQRIERDYAEIKNLAITADDMRSLSADIVTNITSVSSAINTDIHSVSAVLSTDFYSNDASVYATTVSDNASLYALVELDLRSLSLDIDAAIRSTSFDLKNDMISVAVSVIGGGFGISEVDLRSMSSVIKTDISSVSGVIQASIDSISNTVSIIAVNLASISNTISAIAANLNTLSLFAHGSLSSAEVYLRGSISNTISIIAANLAAVSNTVSFLNTFVINPKAPAYGAVGDGATDDTAALKAALIAARGNILYIPSGQYKLYGGLTLTTGSVHIMGAGMGSTELTWAATATSVGIVLFGTASAHFHHVSDVKLSTAKDGGIALTCDYSNEMTNIGGLIMTLDRVSPRTIVERTYITGVGSDADPTVNNWYEGINIAAGLYCTVRDVTIVCKGQLDSDVYRAADALRYAINFVGSPASGNVQNGHPVVIYVHNCNITYPYVGVQAVNTEGVFVTDNNIVFGNYGILVSSESGYGHPQAKITGNHVNMYQDCVLLIGQTQNTICDNLFYGSQAAVTNASSINLQSCNYTVLASNQFQSWGHGSYLGVNVASKYVSIDNNVFKQWSNTATTATMSYPIVLQATAQNIRGGGNVYAGTFTANILTVAGATDIILDATGGVLDSDLRSLSTVIKADIASVSAVLETHINSVSATINTRLNARLPVAICNFKSTTGTITPAAINKIFNISTVSRSATGIFKINFISNVDVTKGLTVIGVCSEGPLLTTGVGIATGSVKVWCYSLSGEVTTDQKYVSFVAYANTSP